MRDAPTVDKRISAPATDVCVIETICGLDEVEICCEPRFESGKNAIDFAGMVAIDV